MLFRSLPRALESGSVSAIRVAADLLGIEPGALQAALAKPPADSAFKGRREVALIALSQLARTDPQAAAKRLEAGVPGFTAGDQLFAWSQIAAGGMRRMAPESIGWTQRGAKAAVSDDTLNWLTRAALRDQAKAAEVGQQARRVAETKYSYEAYLDKTKRACAALDPSGSPLSPGSPVKDVA